MDQQPQPMLRPRISELIPEFLEHLRTEERSAPGTIERYKGNLTRFAAAIGDCRADEITSEKLSLHKRQLTDRGLSAAGIATIISSVRSFFRYLRAVKGWQTYDPEKIKRPRVPVREVAYLNKVEVRRFLDAIPTRSLAGMRDRALAEILFATGMRISEATSINRIDLDWEAKEARIIGKGNKERRIYFSEGALERLSEYLRHRTDDHPALFATQGPEPGRLSPADVWQKFRGYGIRAGLAKRISPHMLRHTMATTLLANGCPIGHIRTLLGHRQLQTTCRYYLGIISDKEAKAAHEKYLGYEEGTEKTDGASVGR